MPAILMSDFSVFNAENFINSVICDESNMYIAVGRGYTTGTDLTIGEGASKSVISKDDYLKWDDESNPPTPRDTINQEEDFRKHIIGIKKVSLNNIRLMVPRIQWKAGLTDFRPIDKSRLMGKRAQNYYCVTSENEVWQCMYVPTDESGRVKPTMEGCEPSLAVFTNTAIVTEYADEGKTIISNVNSEGEQTNEPTEVKTSKDFPAREQVAVTNVKLDSLNTTIFYENKTADGYVWRFLYDIETSLVNNGLLLKNWMPVPYNNHAVYGNGYGGTITDKQNKYGDKNANETLGAYRVLVNVEIGDCGTDVPFDAVYRQVGIIMNPRTKLSEDQIHEELTGEYDTSIDRKNTLGSLLTGDTYSNLEFDLYSGLLVFLDNKNPIVRNASQTEQIQLLLVF